MFELLFGRFSKQSSGGRGKPRGTGLGSLAVAQVEAHKAERARAGVRFAAVNGNGSTFLAPVQAVPTTTLTMALWNGSNNKTLFLDTAFAFLASGTPDVGGALIGCVTTVAQARPTLSSGSNGGYANTVISGLSGQKGGMSKAVFINAITLTGDQPSWFVLDGKPQSTATAKVAAGSYFAEVHGGIAIPPGYMLGLAVLAGAGTTPLYGFGVTWDEYESDVESA